MKKIILSAIILLQLPAFAQEKILEASSEIYQVNLFTRGAQIKRKAAFQLDKGISRVVIQGVSNNLDPASIRVSASNDIVILTVTHKSAIISNPKKLPIIRMMEDSLDLVSYQIEEEKNLRFVLDQEQSLLLANKELKGDKGVNLIDLEDALLLYRKQLSSIRKGLLESTIRESRLNQRKTLLEKQLTEFRQSNQQPSYEILVTLTTAMAQRNASLDLSYFVSEASWEPLYDLRVKNLNSPIELLYKAEVRNNSGENWENVKLHLSSANPDFSGVPPVLYTQRLYTGSVQPASFSKRGDKMMKSYTLDEPNVASIEADIQQKGTSFEFVVPVNINAVANNQPQAIELFTHQLKGNFSYFTVPKLEKEAFLITGISGWEDLNLLAGNASIYFEGTFVGSSLIDPGATQDTLNVSLGRDKGIVVQREKLREFSSSNITGSRKKEILVYQISIRNTKKEPVFITIEDQVPVSSAKDISVDVTELSGGTWNAADGKVTWRAAVAPGETINLRLGFEVKYPKDHILYGL
jgi:uncharacterized protein (TIGR02231 family)